MGTHYRNIPEFEQLERLMVEQIIFQAFDIVDKRRPNTTFKKLFKKIVKVRLDAFEGIPPYRILQYISTKRFFEILREVALIMSHRKVNLTEEDVKEVTIDTPIHDFFDIIDRLYTVKEEKENVKK